MTEGYKTTGPYTCVPTVELEQIHAQLAESKRECADEENTSMELMAKLKDTQAKLRITTEALKKITHDEWEVISDSTGLRQSGPSDAAQIAETALAKLNGHIETYACKKPGSDGCDGNHTPDTSPSKPRIYVCPPHTGDKIKVCGVVCEKCEHENELDDAVLVYYEKAQADCGCRGLPGFVCPHDRMK